MPEEYQRIELITGTARRRHWSTEQKLRIIEESFEPGETVSSAARRNGVAPNLLYRWRRLMSEGGVTAVGSDEAVVGNSEVLDSNFHHLLDYAFERVLSIRKGHQESQGVSFWMDRPTRTFRICDDAAKFHLWELPGDVCPRVAHHLSSSSYLC
jgi:hypothetical protein